MAKTSEHPPTLCYLDAGRVKSPAGDLAGLDVRGKEDETLGRITGVLIDPQVRRLRYFVVESPGWFRHRRYLLPLDAPASLVPGSGVVRVALTPRDLTCCEEFDGRAAREFGDEDVLAALFTPRAA